MPVTRPFSIEEDVTISISTTIAGLVGKYNVAGRVEVGPLFTSILGNMCLSLNQLIEESPLSVVEKATIRGNLKAVVAKALRPKIGLVDRSAPHEHIPADYQAPAPKE